MITEKLSQDELMRMVDVWTQYKDSLKPNRRKGIEVVRFLQKKYKVSEITDEDANLRLSETVLMNEHLRSKLEKDSYPNFWRCEILREGPGIKLYEDEKASEIIYVSIDLSSGCFFVESCPELWDELICYQGLDKTDLDNPVAVCEYIECMKKFGKM